MLSENQMSPPRNTIPFRPQSDELERMKALIQAGQPTLLLGPTGCGKTTAIESLNRPYITVLGGTLKTPQDLLGRYVLRGGESVFMEGPLLLALEQNLLLYLDEIHEARPEALACLKSVADHRRSIQVNGTLHQARDGFALVASGVPPLRNMNPELRQRWSFIELKYLPPAAEADLIVSLSGVAKAEAEFLVRVATQTRTSLNTITNTAISTRALLQVAQCMAKSGWTRDFAVNQLLWRIAEKEDHGELRDLLAIAGLYSRQAIRTSQPAESLDVSDNEESSTSA